MAADGHRTHLRRVIRPGGITCLAQVDVPSSRWTADHYCGVHDTTPRVRHRAPVTFCGHNSIRVVYALLSAHQCELGRNGGRDGSRCAGGTALFQVPSLTAPAPYALWYMSMDLD